MAIGYTQYIAGNEKKHTFHLSESFAREKSGGKKVTYTNPIAVEKNGGWRYGAMGICFIVDLSEPIFNYSAGIRRTGTKGDE